MTVGERLVEVLTKGVWLAVEFCVLFDCWVGRIGRKGDLVDILWSRRKTVVSGVVR